MLHCTNMLAILLHPLIPSLLPVQRAKGVVSWLTGQKNLILDLESVQNDSEEIGTAKETSVMETLSRQKALHLISTSDKEDCTQVDHSIGKSLNYQTILTCG